MTLADDIAEAEQRARDAVHHAIRYGETMIHVESGDALKSWCGCDRCVALDRYAAVCRLAGRWEQISNAYVGLVADVEARVRADLARLMEGCP